jgi:tetratricopeptide (TPR) repeat protein
VLRDLTRREILELDEDPRSPERGQYRFVQSLIREVAYSRLSRSDRVRLHLQVAAQFEAAGDVEAAGIVASHYTDAAASDPGDRELADRARHAIVAAAERAVSLHSHDQAITLYERAIDLAVSDVDKAHLQLDLADAFAQAGRYADGVDIARRALEVFEEVGDPQGVVIAATTAAAHLCTSFRADEAADLIVPVYERTPRSSDAVWANLASQTSRALMLATRSPESVEIVDSALPVMEALDLTEEIVETAINKGTALFNMGRWVEGTVILRGAADLAQRRDMTRAAMRAINNLATMAAADNRRDRSFTDEMERMLPRLGDLGWQVRTTVDAVQFNLDFGEFEEMRERLARARELSAATETNEYLEVERLRLECVVSSAEEAPTDELLRFIEPFMSTADPQLRSFAHLTKAEALLFAGRFGEVIPLVDSPLADPYPEVFDPGLVAGAWTADVEGLSHMEEVVADRFSRGRACRTLGLFIGATRAALVGDREAAVALFEEADELGREVTPPRQLALMNVAIARAAGLDHPLGHRAGSAAAGFFEEAGFRIYLELFADALPLRSEDSATAAG